MPENPNTSKIILNNLHIAGKRETNVKINIEFAELEKIYLYCRWADSFSLSNSIIKSGLGIINCIEVTPLINDSYIERNVFIGNGMSNFVDAGNPNKDGNLYIRNNVFLNPLDFAIRCGFNTVVENNSFLNTEKVGISLSANSIDFKAQNIDWPGETHNGRAF